jgi:diacylglycerol kinase family enzyme
MKEMAVLLNPSSGGGKSLQKKNKIEEYFKNNNIKYDLFISKSEHHLRELAQETIAKYPTIIGVGGDTTFNIIVKEILDRGGRNTFGTIGTGSTNDFVRGLGIQKTRTACETIKRGKVKKIDTGLLRLHGISEPYYFLSALSLGLGVTVPQYVNYFNINHKTILKTRLLGQTIPGILGIYDSFSKKKLPIKLSIEYNHMRKKHSVSLLAFLNTPYVANGLNLTPEASPFDGKIDGCILKTPSFFSSFLIGLMSYKGKHIKRKEVELIRTESIKVRPEHPIDIQIDGIILSDIKEFEVSVAPQALNILL